MAVRLVVFDVDGTLTRHNSIWWRLHQVFGSEKQGKEYYDQFFSGKITYRQWADLDAALWRGKSLKEIEQIVQSTELVPGAQQTIEALKANGMKVAILSGGVDLLANDVARRLGIDYVLTNHLLHRDGVLTGEVEVNVGWGAKVEEIGQIVDHFGTTLRETCFVGDGKNDISVFSVVGLSIAFRPENDDVANSASVVIREDDLRLILPHIVKRHHVSKRVKT